LTNASTLDLQVKICLNICCYW